MVDKGLLFCLVGRGSIGTRHVRNLKSLSCNRIIAYSQREDPDKDSIYFNEHAVKTVHSLEDVREARPDVFIIANPTSEHLKFARLAVDLGCHVFMEKPLSDTLEEAVSLSAEVLSAKVVFSMANNLRFHPAIVKIREMLIDGVFGRLFFARVMGGQYLPDWHPGEDYRRGYSARKDLGGGVVLTLQHEIDYAFWLFGSMKFHSSIVRKVSGLEIDVEDCAAIIGETAEGTMLEIHLDYLQRPPRRSIHIEGEKGSLEYRFGDDYLAFYDVGTGTTREVLDLHDYDVNQMYVDEMTHFLDCIANGTAPRAGIADGVETLKTCLAIKQENGW